MQIKRYRGADMQEALQKVKQELGTDAIILSTRQVRGGGGKFGLFGKPILEVTAARDPDGSVDTNGSVPDRPFTTTRGLWLACFTSLIDQSIRAAKSFWKAWRHRQIVAWSEV